MNALGEIGPAAAAGVPQLVELLKNGEPNSRYAIVEALGKIGPAAAAALPAFEPFTNNALLILRLLSCGLTGRSIRSRPRNLAYGPRENEEYEGEYEEDY